MQSSKSLYVCSTHSQGNSCVPTRYLSQKLIHSITARHVMDSSDRDCVRILSTRSPLSCFLSYLTKFVATSIKDYVSLHIHYTLPIERCVSDRDVCPKVTDSTTCFASIDKDTKRFLWHFTWWTTLLYEYNTVLGRLSVIFAKFYWVCKCKSSILCVYTNFPVVEGIKDRLGKIVFREDALYSFKLFQ